MDKKAYSMARSSSNKYVDQVLDGITLINGADCTIDSVVPSEDGKYTTVTFGWTGTNTGQHYTEEMVVYNGGNGRSITAVAINNSLHLLVSFDDGTIQDAGALPIPIIEVGETQTVEYNEQAEVTAETTEKGVKLNFKIPRGEPGGVEIIWHIV